MKTFHLPDLGEGLAEAEIREWYVKVGEMVKTDQPLVSMETAKAVVDVPSPYAGKIVQLHGHVNDIIQTGAPLITFEIGEMTNHESKGTVVGSLEESATQWDEGEVVVGTAKKTLSQSIKAMPAARILAKQMNVDLALVKPTGPQGLVTVDDVKQLIARQSHSTLPRQTEGLHGVRRVMAQIMAQSHQEVVPVTIIEDADISSLPPDTDLTVQLLKAMVAGVKAEPALNAWFDGKSLERKLFDEVHIGLAVDTPEGLFVPVIKQAESQSSAALRVIIDRYKKLVRDRSVSPTDMQGATITLSNFGIIAGRYATPVIVPPTVAILGCGRVREVAMPRNGQVVVGRILPLSLTVDHRAVTGGEASRFLKTVINYLQGLA